MKTFAVLCTHVARKGLNMCTYTKIQKLFPGSVSQSLPVLATVLTSNSTSVFNLVFTTTNCTAFMEIMFVFLLHCFSTLFFNIFMSIIIPRLPFVANKRVHYP